MDISKIHTMITKPADFLRKPMLCQRAFQVLMAVLTLGDVVVSSPFLPREESRTPAQKGNLGGRGSCRAALSMCVDRQRGSPGASPSQACSPPGSRELENLTGVLGTASLKSVQVCFLAIVDSQILANDRIIAEALRPGPLGCDAANLEGL